MKKFIAILSALLTGAVESKFPESKQRTLQCQLLEGLSLVVAVRFVLVLLWVFEYLDLVTASISRREKYFNQNLLT